MTAPVTIAAPKRTKFGNVRTTVDNISFASRKEARRYGELKLLLAARQIADLRTQPRYPLTVGDTYIGFFTGDFEYVENGKRVCEDVKGGKATKTEAASLRMRVFQAVYPDIELRVV